MGAFDDDYSATRLLGSREGLVEVDRFLVSEGARRVGVFRKATGNPGNGPISALHDENAFVSDKMVTASSYPVTKSTP